MTNPDDTNIPYNPSNPGTSSEVPLVNLSAGASPYDTPSPSPFEAPVPPAPSPYEASAPVAPSPYAAPAAVSAAPPSPFQSTVQQPKPTASFGLPPEEPKQGKGKLKIIVLAIVGLVVLGLLTAIFLGGGDSKPKGAPPAPVPGLSVAPADEPTAPANNVPAGLMQVPSNDPGQAPTAPVGAPPAPVPTAQVPVAAASLDQCEQNMTDYANQNGADAKAYIAQNQAYLTECRKALANPAVKP
ncbi:MAG: hypothetical protein ACOYNL_08010 [Rickettsiales bacterium]